MMHNFVDGISWDSRFAMGDMGAQKICEICGAPWGQFFFGGGFKEIQRFYIPGSDFEDFFLGFSTQ